MSLSKHFMKDTAAGARVQQFTKNMKKIIDQKITEG